MHIQSLQFDPKRNCYVVEIDNAPRLFLSIQTVTEYDLRAKTPLTETLYKELETHSEIQVAKQYTIAYVGSRMVSRKQLTDKLKGRGYGDETIEKVLQWSEEYKLLDDTQYLYYAVKDAIEFKKMGVQKLISNLIPKGFQKDAIEKMYHSLATEEMIQENIQFHINKKKNTIRGKTDMHKKKKLIDYLMRQGFYYDEIKKELSDDEWM